MLLNNDSLFEIDALMNGIDYSVSLSRTFFEKLIGEDLRKSLVLVERCLGDSYVGKCEVHDVVLSFQNRRPHPLEHTLLDL